MLSNSALGFWTLGVQSDFGQLLSHVVQKKSKKNSIVQNSMRIIIILGIKYRIVEQNY